MDTKCNVYNIIPCETNMTMWTFRTVEKEFIRVSYELQKSRESTTADRGLTKIE